MPTRIEMFNRIIDTGIAAVIRAKSSDHLMKVADAIKEGGVDVIEVTMTTPNALAVIEEAANRLPTQQAVMAKLLNAATPALAPTSALKRKPIHA